MFLRAPLATALLAGALTAAPACTLFGVVPCADDGDCTIGLRCAVDGFCANAGPGGAASGDGGGAANDDAGPAADGGGIALDDGGGSNDAGGDGGNALDDAGNALDDAGNALCPNGMPDPGEECDDGNANDGDGCSSGCVLEP